MLGGRSRARLHEHERSKGTRNGWGGGGVARAGAGGGAAWPGRAGDCVVVQYMARDLELELEKLRGRGRRRSQWAVSWVGCRGERSSWGRAVVECVRPWRGWSLPGGFGIGSAGWAWSVCLAGRWAAGSARAHDHTSWRRT